MKWTLRKDGSIRRWNKGKHERIPVSKYELFKNDPDALVEFIKRLNAPQDATLKVEFKHAFISSTLLDEYYRYLCAQIPSPEGAIHEYGQLKRYFLNYFIGRLDLMNPLDWHRVHETQWAEFLLNHKEAKAAKTLRDIVIAANRFMKWLHKQRPTEVPPLEFAPISKAKFKSIEANRELNNEIRERKLIKDSDWKKILVGAEDTLTPLLQLAYNYGLRRSECLGLKCEDVFEESLSVERQLKLLGPVYKPLKGKERRHVKHWYSDASEAYDWIESIKLMHPSTLTDRFNELMNKLGMDYDFHDIRHTYITKALRQHEPRDVQLAAGHKDIRTTMRYSHDDRALSNKRFIKPAA